MDQFEISLAAQSTYFKLKSSSSKDNGIFIETAAFEFLEPFILDKDSKGRDTIQFTIYKQDCIKALGNIMCSLPLYTSKNGIPKEINDPVEVYTHLSEIIGSFFGNSNTRTLTGLYFSELQGRKYLWGTEGRNAIFEIRHFFVANHTTISFQRKGNSVDLRFNTHVVTERLEKFSPILVEDVDVTPQMEFLPDSPYRVLLRAIRTKPFLLLAGISGTGKSRIVRKLAQACWEPGSDESKAQKPSNFEMIQVKPNWHDSSELFGYVSRIGDKPEFIAGDFIKFIAKAWENPDVPYFLCLDEMNLAPVEQYFAEYLSVLESRKLQPDGVTILTDPILKPESEQWYFDLLPRLTKDESLREYFRDNGIRIPQNLIVIGTVNMDETTYSFSRKVLDRAMTIEMNKVDLNSGLHKSDDVMPYIPANHFIADAVEGFDVYEHYEDVCNKVIDYLGAVNEKLDKTPFKIAYRTRNEFLIYVVNALRLTSKEDSDTDEKRNKIIATALDEVTAMKILSRIEGDKRKVNFLDKLKETIKDELTSIAEGFISEVSLPKLDTMEERLKSGYTSFWD